MGCRNMRITNTAARSFTALFFCVLLGVCLLPVQAFAAEDSQNMYRLYNKNTGEHFYTDSVVERDSLVKAGWKNENVGWVSPVKSSVPVYRLYNSHVKGGDHHYTTSSGERDYLISVGWTDEGIGWYSDENKTVPVYRQYNPNATTGTHNYTTSKTENDNLVAQGWHAEDIGWYAIAEGTPSTAIMGNSTISANEMAEFYISKVGANAYPSRVYGSKGAADIYQFCQIISEEAAAENVRADIVFIQAMHETGWLQFKGDVKVDQCNFAGLGATGNGNPGLSFSNVRIGIRAQVQHLKAYASEEDLNNECVDPRFGYVKRGSAPTLEGLTGTWAADQNYANSLIALLSELHNFSGGI